MTEPFNPDTPCVIGLQWYPETQVEYPVTSDINTASFWLDSTATETVESLWVYLTRNLDNGRGFQLEIYDESNLDEQTLVEATALAGSLESSLNGEGYNAGWVAATFGLVDNDPLTPGTFTFPSGVVAGTDGSTWLGAQNGESSDYAFQFTGLAALLPSNAYIRDVGTQCRAQVLTGAVTSSAAVLAQPFMVRGGFRYLGPTLFVGSADVTLRYRWEYDPHTGRAWTRANAALFDTAGVAGNSMGWLIYATGSSEVQAVIYQVGAEVRYLAVDPRVAVGAFVDRAPLKGWREIALTTPTGVANWAKQAGGVYVGTLRRRSGLGYAWVRFLRSTLDAPQSLVDLSGTFDDANALSSVAENRNSAMAAILDLGGSCSVDSQPYAQVGGDVEWASIGADANSFWADVSNAGDVEQTIANGGAPMNVDFCRFIARGDTGIPTADLSVSVYRETGMALVDGPHLIAAADVLGDNPLEYQVVDLSLTGFTANASENYVVRFSCASDSPDGWKIGALSTLSQLASSYAPPAGADAVNFQGTTGYGTWRGVDHDELDYAVTLHTIPDPPANQTVAVAASAVACVNYATVSWDAVTPATCGGFSHYEVERSDDGAQTWQTIAVIGDPTDVDFDDYEARRGVAVVYRVRVVRYDGAPSGWATTASTTVPMACCGYIFTSNQLPADTLWFDDVGARPYDFLENVTLRQYEGRDGQVAFQELVDRLDRLAITLLIAAEGGQGGTVVASPEGRRVFDDLLILCGNKKDRVTGAKTLLPYVCVLDSDGNRWYANVQTPKGVREEPGGTYTIDVIVTELTQTPVPVETESTVTS